MDVPGWGTSYVHCAALGEKAVVCLDTGHHAPGTNIELVVMQLLRLGKLGSFDLNSRNYADDDLIVELPRDPMTACNATGYQERIEGDRVGAPRPAGADQRLLPRWRRAPTNELRNRVR